jgi:hypothetical protein
MTVNLKLISISCEPGKCIIPLNDSQRCSLVHKGPIFPELSDDEYPKKLQKSDMLVLFTTVEF